MKLASESQCLYFSFKLARLISKNVYAVEVLLLVEFCHLYLSLPYFMGIVILFTSIHITPFMTQLFTLMQILQEFEILTKIAWIEDEQYTYNIYYMQG